MDISYIVAGACGLLAIAALLLRSNAVYMLMGLCAGSVLASLAAKDVTQIFNSFINVNVPVYSYVQIVLLIVAPLILLFVYKKARGNNFMLQVVPAVALASLCFMFVTDMLPYDVQSQIKDSQVYMFIQPYFEIAIAVGLFASLIYFWAKKPSHDKRKKS